MTGDGQGFEETLHRGIRWRRRAGETSFYDPERSCWVRWGPGVDAPPLPPGWGGARARPPRPGWLTPWRLVPLAITALVIGFALLQVLHPSPSQEKKETAAAQALLGKCLARHGTLEGHPKYSASPVPCSSAKASVKVVKVIPSTPGSPLCPGGTVGVELPYPGVRYPHILCVTGARQAHLGG